MKNLVSIIVPIYNAEKYLERCIDSLLGQTYEAIQIVLINDGSKDQSDRICKCYIEKDTRIKYIVKENAGVGAARNTGIEEADGDYICFVDADDYVEPQFIESLLSMYEQENAQLAICGFSEVHGEQLVNQTKGDKVCMSQEEAMYRLMCEDSYKGYVWNKMFRKDIIQEYGLQFDTRIAIWEDVLFVFQYMCHISSIIYDPKPLYKYLYNVVSASHENNHILGVEKAFSVIEAQKQIEKMIPATYESVRQQLSIRYIQSSLAVIRNIGYLKQGKNTPYYKESLYVIKTNKKTGYRYLNKKDKILVNVTLVCPNILLWLYGKR